MMPKKAISLRLDFTFAFAGLWGTTLPWGRGTPISSYWVLRTVCLLLLGLTIRESLVSMDTGDLMDAVLPFLRKGAAGEITAGPGGSLPDPSGGGPVFPLVAASERDEDTGSPSWEDLSPLEELSPEHGLPTEEAPLEREHGLPTEGGADMEAEPSNSRQEEAPEPKRGRRFYIDARFINWKTRAQVAQALADKEYDQRFGMPRKGWRLRDRR